VLSYCYGIFACFFFCRKQIMKLSKKNMKSWKLKWRNCKAV
jgi:uncharacterized protein YneF (UPF0154 family)